MIEQRYADNHLDRLPDLASDLISRKVATLGITPGSPAPISIARRTFALTRVR
jgi:hypothetical protein